MPSFEQAAVLGQLPEGVNADEFWRKAGAQTDTMGGRLFKAAVKRELRLPAYADSSIVVNHLYRLRSAYPLPSLPLSQEAGDLTPPRLAVHVSGEYWGSVEEPKPNRIWFSIGRHPEAFSAGESFWYTQEGFRDERSKRPLYTQPPRLLLARNILNEAGVEADFWTPEEFPTLEAIALAAADVELGKAEVQSS